MRGTATILVVDDDPALVNMMKENLEVEGHIVLTGYDGAMAVQAVQEAKPHLIIIDVNMPGMGGLEAVDELRKSPELASIPVVFLSGEERNPALHRAAQLPAVTRLVKPVDLDQLNALTRQLLNQYYPD